MTATTRKQPCPECYPQGELVFWRDLPMNESIREYVSTYISPPAMYYASLADALAVWGQDFNPEDFIDD
ncbi:hypothetical protein D3C81_1070700 [compost metagenome]